MRQRVFRRNLSVLSLILVIVLAPTSFGRSAPDFNQASQAQRQRRPFPPTQYIPSHDYDTKHIALNLRFDWEKEQAIGTETIDLSPLARNLKQVLLDAAFMSFASVKLANGTPLQYKFDEKNQKLDIALIELINRLMRYGW